MAVYGIFFKHQVFFIHMYNHKIFDIFLPAYIFFQIYYVYIVYKYLQFFLLDYNFNFKLITQWYGYKWGNPSKTKREITVVLLLFYNSQSL